MMLLRIKFTRARARWPLSTPAGLPAAPQQASGAREARWSNLGDAQRAGLIDQKSMKYT